LVLGIYKVDIPYIPCQSRQGFHNYINILTEQIISINPYKLIQTLFYYIEKYIYFFKIRQIIGNMISYIKLLIYTSHLLCPPNKVWEIYCVCFVSSSYYFYYYYYYYYSFFLSSAKSLSDTCLGDYCTEIH
jgi:hypothetical protein